LTALLPGLGQLGASDLDPLDPVRPPGAAKLIALLLQAAELLWRESVLHRAQVPLGDPGLDVDERALRPLGQADRIEGGVHAANVPDPTLAVRLTGWSLHPRTTPAAARPALPRRTIGARSGVRRLGSRGCTVAQHPEHEEARAADQQQLQHAQAAPQPPAH